MRARQKKTSDAKRQMAQFYMKQVNEARKAAAAADLARTEAEQGLAEVRMIVNAIVIRTVLTFGEAQEDGSVRMKMPRVDVMETSAYEQKAALEGEDLVITVTKKPEVRTDKPA